jgi:predicted esterase
MTAAVAAFCSWRFVPRPERLGLATVIDGPAPQNAGGVVIFLHGLNRGFNEGRTVARELREAGLPADISIVLIRAPYGHGVLGFSWGDTPEARARSRARIRAELDRLRVPSRGHVVIAGFSQGATLALDTAAEEPRIGAVASLSPCYSERRGDLAARDLRFLLAHGARDTTCPVEESRSLARVLERSGRRVHYVEFDGPHGIPPEVVTALVTFATE